MTEIVRWLTVTEILWVRPIVQWLRSCDDWWPLKDLLCPSVIVRSQSSHNWTVRTWSIIFPERRIRTTYAISRLERKRRTTYAISRLRAKDVHCTHNSSRSHKSYTYAIIRLRAKLVFSTQSRSQGAKAVQPMYTDRYERFQKINNILKKIRILTLSLFLVPFQH